MTAAASAVWGAVAALTVASLVAAGCSDRNGSADRSTADPVAAAEALCPIMWTWVKDVGSAFNDTSRAVGDIDDVEQRRQRWMEFFDTIEDRTDRLGTDVSGYRDDPILAPIVAEIERDITPAMAELDDIRDLFVEFPEVDDERHQIRTSQIIVRLEKVIDLPKPELADLDTDGTLIPAFQTVPSCQQSIKDVDDGSTRAND